MESERQHSRHHESVSNGELIFTVTTMGGLACFEVATGKLIWQKDLELEVQASPAIAASQLLLGYQGGTDLAASRA